MTKYRVLLAVGLICLSVPSQAKRVGWCEVRMENAPGGSKYFSGLVEVGDSQQDFLTFRDETFGPAFQQYVKGLQGYAVAPSCGTARTLEEAQSDMERTIQANPTMTFRKTDWSGDFTRASGSEKRDDEPANALIVRGPSADEIAAQEAKDAQRELEGQRAMAASVAKRVAEDARLKAETQAKIAKFMDEAKKRGSAQ
jgi:hypothetical protein